MVCCFTSSACSFLMKSCGSLSPEITRFGADRALPTTATMMTKMAITPVIIYSFRHELIPTHIRSTATAASGMIEGPKPKKDSGCGIFAIKSLMELPTGFPTKSCALVATRHSLLGVSLPDPNRGEISQRTLEKVSPAALGCTDDLQRGWTQRRNGRGHSS